MDVPADAPRASPVAIAPRRGQLAVGMPIPAAFVEHAAGCGTRLIKRRAEGAHQSSSECG
jgi:hypothetical protein